MNRRQIIALSTAAANLARMPPFKGHGAAKVSAAEPRVLADRARNTRRK